MSRYNVRGLSIEEIQTVFRHGNGSSVEASVAQLARQIKPRKPVTCRNTLGGAESAKQM